MLGTFILETANAPGTSATVNLAGAATGRRSFAAAFSSGAAVFYFIDDGTQAEWGYGTFTTGSPNTLTRGTVLKNTSNNTSRLNFTGAIRVYNEIPAERAVYGDAAGNVSLLGLSATSMAVSGALAALSAAIVGVITAAGATISGTVFTVGLTASGAVAAASAAISGAVTAASATISGAVSAASAAISGTITAGLFSGKGAVLIGAGTDYYGSTLPTGYLWADGSAVSRTTYAALYAAIGTIFGAGDGSTTFNLPDRRGRAAFGRDNMGGTAAGRLTSGNSGITGTTLGAAGGDERMPIHNHTASQGGHSHPLDLVDNTGGGVGAAFGNGALQATTNTGTTTAPAITVNNAGAGSGGNVPPALVCNHIIFAGV